MADEAPGPDGKGADMAQLAEADMLFEDGLQAIRDNALEKAVELLAKVLQTRIAHYGEMAEACGTAYYRYGAALLYRAQEEQDVFGDDMQSAAQERDIQVAAARVVAEAEAEAEADAEEAAEAAAGCEERADVGDGNAGKADVDNEGHANLEAEDAKGSGAAAGTSPVEEPLLEGSAQESGSEGGDEKEGEGDATEEGPPDPALLADQDEATSDLKLSWENLEVAKHIFCRNPEKYPIELADVHMLLADLACEDEGFRSALPDYEAALDLLTRPQPGMLPVTRRIAEVHYKIGLALQFLEEPAKALHHTQLAVQCCRRRLSVLEKEARSAAAQSDDAAVAVAKKEISGLEDSLSGLHEREVELKDVITEAQSAREMIKAAFTQITAGGPSAAAASSDGAGPSGAGPSGSGSAFGSGALCSTAAAAPVTHLGVVGRGKTRITLQPTAAAAGPSAARNGGHAFAAAAAAAEAEGAAPPAKKRSLEDCMGSAAGESSSELGGPFSSAAAAAVAGTGAALLPVGLPKKRKDAAGAPAVPAFLSTAAVSAVHGAGYTPEK